MTASPYVYDTCHKAKLDDDKSLFKYLGQPAIDYVSSIPDKCGPGNDSDEDI